MSFVVVWRDADGAAVQTFAHDDKSPRVFDTTDAPEVQNAGTAGATKLAGLLEAKDAFEPVRVDVAVARDVLGWTV